MPQRTAFDAPSRRRASPSTVLLIVGLSVLTCMNAVRLANYRDNASRASIPRDDQIAIDVQMLRPRERRQQPRAPRRPKLADGCYHVFLDVGSNIAMHARFLYEPSLYPKAWLARKFFSEHFGPEQVRDNRDFCIFAFEPNPRHRRRHVEMTKAYGRMGWRYRFFPVGVGDENGEMTFYDIGGDELGLGYSAVPKKSCADGGCPETRVPVIRFSDWIHEHVHDRLVPPRPFGGRGFVAGPKVAMKMDIEMLEWLVMPDLIASGVLCRDIDGMMGEYHLSQHWHLYPITFPHHPTMGDGNKGNGSWTLHNYTEAEKFLEHVVGMLQKNEECKTKLELRDDESHAEDGMPWPEPPR